LCIVTIRVASIKQNTLRNLKTVMGMDRLSCKTPDMNEKELGVYLLAYNLIRFLMEPRKQAQEKIRRDGHPKKIK
jgi:hypothetical protein